MSLFSLLKAKFSKAHAHRSLAAANQLYAALQRGCNIELPQNYSKDDETGQAVTLMLEMHPDANISLMLQSKTLVLSIGKQGEVSPDAWKTLEKHGYFPDTKLTPESLLAVHAKFSKAAGLSPEEVQRQNLDADQKRHAVVAAGAPGAGE